MRGPDTLLGAGRRPVARRLALVVLAAAMFLPSARAGEARVAAPVDAGLESWTVTDALRALGLGLVLVYGAFVATRFRRRRRDPHETRVESAVAAIRSSATESDASLVPRTLPNSPFTGAADLPTLEGQIEIAAEACVRLSRTIGVIYFEVPGHAQIVLREGEERASEIVSALADALRHRLRATDHLAVIDGRRIVVCVCLLDKATDLEGIARRLAVVVQRHGLTADDGAAIRPGLSVYPLHGYRGSELVGAAVRDYRGGSRPLEPPPDIVALEPPASPQEKGKRPGARGHLTVVAPPPEDEDGS